MSFRQITQCAWVAVVLLGSGCAAEDLGSACALGVTVTVSSGIQPTITWQPNCEVSDLIIYENITTTTVWSITSNRRLTSPIRYGHVPKGAVEEVPAAALNRGESYLLYLKDENGDFYGSGGFVP